MRFKSFKIKDFKGIKDATVELIPAGSNVYTLVGLNESGKTTVLEAINSFGRSETDVQELYSGGSPKEQPASLVPKHRKSNFTGEIVVEAVMCASEEDRAAIVKETEEKFECTVDLSSFPLEFYYRRGMVFKNSDYQSYHGTIGLSLTLRRKETEDFVEVESEDAEWKFFANALAKRVPNIVYFPTFLFTQPQRIVLNPDPKGPKEPTVNRIYREIIENVASSLDSPLDVDEHIVKRVLNEDTLTQKALAFFMLAPDKQEQINASLNELSSHLTETVFDSWSRIFGGNFAGREIVLRLGIDSSISPPSVYVEFGLKDGVSTYGIAERSLGFRWFFSFILFTLYTVSAKRAGKPTLFLLDEPASNLHSRAQMQLLENLPRIATGDNQIIFSTHSHYMINPDWLDQSFIVSNAAVDYQDVAESSASSRSRATDISVKRYRDFVGTNPDKITYFQPVIDKLSITPSKFDLNYPTVVVEGKGDYYILQYGRNVILRDDAGFKVVPSRGASGMAELGGLLLGWSVPFVLCFDDDTAGIVACQDFRKNWAFSEKQAQTLANINADLKGMTIEGFLDPSDLDMVSQHFGLTGIPTKSQIQLFFGEKNAKREVVAVSTRYKKLLRAFNKRMKTSLAG